MMPAFHSLVGQRVDRYEVLAQLGQGGFGAVYRARHAVLGTEVALKVLWPERAEDPEAVERFLREAKTAASIGSPHIVHVGDAGTTADGVVFLAMELLVGHDLERELTTRERLPPHEALDILRQVLVALGAAHRRGIVHRDLKPANVFLVPGPDGAPFVKLLDFGVSKVKGQRSLTASGVALGTPQYMAPEQLEGAREIDGRVDLYAAGCMLYEMLSGRVPFEGTSIDVLVRRLAGEKPPELRSMAPHVPEALALVTHRALAFDRDARFASAEAMADALLAAEDGMASVDAVPTVPPGSRWVTPVSTAIDPYAATGAVSLAAITPAVTAVPAAVTPVSVAANNSRPHPPTGGASTPSVVVVAPRARRAHPALFGAIGALAVVLAVGAGALGVGAYRHFTRDARPSIAAPSTAPEEPSIAPIARSLGESAPPSAPARPPAPAALPVDPAGVRYRLIEVAGLGPRSEIDALLERARPGVARCAIPGRALHLAVYFIGTIAGHVSLAGPSMQRPSDDSVVAGCVGRAIAAAGPMRFSGLQTATVELDVDLPAQ